MKISSVNIVVIDYPEKALPPSRRPNANRAAARAFPINKYPEFSALHTRIPGAIPGEFWVQVVAEDGTWGLGQGSWGGPVAAAVETIYAPLILGKDCLAVEYLADIMWRASQRTGGEGINCIARSAVDLALWDLKGKLLEVPVYSLLGGPVREAINCYCTSDDLDWAIELGFERFKISNPVHYDHGEDGLRLAERKVAAARDAVGDRELMYNPVMSFNVDFAVRIAERLRPYSLRWIEEPLMPWDMDGLLELRRRAGWVCWATGEDHHGRHAFRALLERRCVDVIQPDIRWCGGLSELLKIYHLAESFGVATIPHFGANNAYGQHFHIAAPEAAVAEYWMGSDPGVPLAEVSRIPGVAVPENGKVRPSDAPGFGMDIPKEWIRPVKVLNEDFR
ncbi:enolase C-terminal domain-like protein [Chelativorans sp. Marseille-P2723]|uniref:enolase C-terminal domain-like protein n=1 Tax=Chelativorans sp. Marseille-P2723 TaxID=2709133 RepID=UPI0015703AC0|nr:enolase C-terminal domain-like protein [Chelativorans sp. Marseille-P2723]